MCDGVPNLPASGQRERSKACESRRRPGSLGRETSGRRRAATVPGVWQSIDVPCAEGMRLETEVIALREVRRASDNALGAPSFEGLRPAAGSASHAKRMNRSADTRRELTLRQQLWKRGLRFGKNVEALPGKPDIVFVKHCAMRRGRGDRNREVYPEQVFRCSRSCESAVSSPMSAFAGMQERR